MDFLASFTAFVKKSVSPQVAPKEQVTVEKTPAGFLLDWRAVRK
jgi:hypothetical protein